MVPSPYMHAFTNVIPPMHAAVLAIVIPLILVAVVWTLVLKGFALWYAARGGQKSWFIVMLILNTLGILEIVYLIWFRPRKVTEAPSGESVVSTAA